MLPNINGNMIVPPSPRRHAHYAVPIDKINSYSTFLDLKSNPLPIQPPFDFADEPEVKPLVRIVSEGPEDPNNTIIRLERSGSMIRKNSLVERREISIPNNSNMPRTHTRTDSIEDRPHKKLHTELNYIRVDYMQSVPTADVYEATDNDLKFLFELNQKIFNGCENSCNKPEITASQFESLIVAWEHATADGNIISLDRALEVEEASSCLKNNFSMDEIKPVRIEALTEIYNYWKGKREEYKRPLLRKYLKATNTDYTNPNIAFLRRKENKFARRRSQRTSSPVDDLKRMKNLRKNMERSSLLLSNIKYREMLKLEAHEIKNKMFEEQVKAQLGESYSLFESICPKLESITHTDQYKEARKKLEECSRRGEMIARTINSVRKDSFKSDISIESKRKLSSIQASTSSIPSTASSCATTTTTTKHPHKPMSLGLSKMTNTLPKNLHGSFTLPIKKSSIDLRDLRVKLKQSIGSLYLKSQEENRVKVELGSPGQPKMEEESLDKENQNANVQKKIVKESHEELIIKVELEEFTEKGEGEKTIHKTTVRYSIHFHETSANPYSRPVTLESAKPQGQQSTAPQTQFLPRNGKVKS